MWWRPAWFSLKGKMGIRGQRRGAVLRHPALSTNRPADPCTTAAGCRKSHTRVGRLPRHATGRHRFGFRADPPGGEAGSGTAADGKRLGWIPLDPAPGALNVD